MSPVGLINKVIIFHNISSKSILRLLQYLKKIIKSLLKVFWNLRSRRWGSSLTVWARLTVHSAWAEIFRPTCLQSHLQTSPPTPQKSYPKFRNPRTTFENNPLCPPKYSIVRGVGGSPNFVRVWNPHIFLRGSSNYFVGWNPNIFAS